MCLSKLCLRFLASDFQLDQQPNRTRQATNEETVSWFGCDSWRHFQNTGCTGNVEGILLSLRFPSAKLSLTFGILILGVPSCCTFEEPNISFLCALTRRGDWLRPLLRSRSADPPGLALAESRAAPCGVTSHRCYGNSTSPMTETSTAHVGKIWKSMTLREHNDAQRSWTPGSPGWKP